MKTILAHTPEELREVFRSEGLEPFRANQITRWVYGQGVRDFGQMTNLARSLRESLPERWTTRSLTCESVHRSNDGTRKLVLRTEDDARIETVIIPEDERRTLCVSSQVGCSLDCSFCATGRLGFGRNLRADEIVEQYLTANAVLAEEGEQISHVVFMGMGEPLLNLGEVVQAIRVLTDPQAASLASRRITVSTAGIVPRIAELGEAVPVRLAISLHATTDAVRNRLVPINRRFPLEALMDACRRYPVARRDRISFEYTLIRDVNDSMDDVRRLVALLHGLKAKVNVIPLNEHPGADYRRPDDATVEAFVEALAQKRITATVRRSRGDDIFAACGQLGALSPTNGTTGHDPSNR